MLGYLDKMVQVYLKAVSSHCTAMNSNIAPMQHQKAFTQGYPDIVGNIDTTASSFAPTFFEGTHSGRCQEKNRISISS